MKIQECRRLERDRQTTMPLRPNPKRTESSDQAIQDTEIRRTPPRAIQDQQLVFGQNGFRDDGSHTAWLKYALTVVTTWTRRRIRSRIPDFKQRSKPFYFNVIWNSRGTGQVVRSLSFCTAGWSDMR